MLVSLEWLSSFVDISDLTSQEIAHGLTMSGLEVEDTEELGCKFTNIVVAEILNCKPHPNADKLQLVEVFNGKDKMEVVCGAKNIQAGQLIPYASIGSAVLDRKSGEAFVLKPVKIRGVESQGMLCSADELGLNPSDYQEEDGILILNRIFDNLTPGQDVKNVLDIADDTVLHVVPTANRGDEMSIIGIAREVAAIFDKELNHVDLEYTNTADLTTDINIEIKDEDCCKYYTLAILKDINIKESPKWMINRLNASGIRSINNVVDITNYVMLEYGQPLHAFDSDKINSNYIYVRRANDGEKIVTLDETERKLSTETVLIASDKEPIALGGVMGGFTTEIDENTKNVALESAYFTPVTNRRSSRSVGFRTDSCARFERSVDIQKIRPALIRAMQLLTELADAKVCDIIEDGGDELENIEITLRFSQVKRILGIEILNNKCVEILEKLGFELLGKNDFSAKFLVPSHRINDVTREIDLIEEIARINGYDKIEPTLPQKTLFSETSEETNVINKINSIFTGDGFYEVVTTSLVGEPLLNSVGMTYDESKAVKVDNPQSDEYTMLRQNVIPNIIQVVKYNFDHGQKDVWIYETGKTFHFNGKPEQKNADVTEKRVLAGALTGNIKSGSWHDSTVPDFYTLKGTIETIFNELNFSKRVEYLSCKDVSYLHPGRTAQIKLLGKGTPVVGYIGEIHPDIKDKCKFLQPVYLFEFDLETIIENIPFMVAKYKELPQYPAVTRDIAFIIPKSVSNNDIMKSVKKSVSKDIFKDIDIFDVYEGKNIPENSKSVAYRITLQDTSTTLTDERVNQEMNKVRKGLQKAFFEINFRE